jgi:hypothetical protein
MCAGFLKFAADFTRPVAKTVIHTEQFDLHRHREESLNHSAQRWTLVVDGHDPDIFMQEIVTTLVWSAQD